MKIYVNHKQVAFEPLTATLFTIDFFIIVLNVSIVKVFLKSMNCESLGNLRFCLNFIPPHIWHSVAIAKALIQNLFCLRIELSLIVLH